MSAQARPVGKGARRASPGGGDKQAKPGDNSQTAGEGKATPDQVRFKVSPKVEPIFYEWARFKALHGGRGSSKSWTFGMYALAKVAQGARCLCVREVQKSLDESARRLLVDLIQKYRIEGFSITQRYLKHESGGLFAFIGLKEHSAETVKSYEGFDLCWVMEAQMLSAESLRALTPTFRKARAELLFEWNPRFPDDPVDAYFRGPDGPPDESLVIEVNHDDNKFFPDALKAEMERDYRINPEMAAHVWGGQYRTGAGGYFAGVLDRHAHILEPFDIPAGWRVDRAHDWGATSPHGTIWFAESNGEAVEVAPGIEYAFPAGTLFAVAEDYGTAGNEVRGWNIGVEETARQIGARIKNVDRALEGRWRGVRVQPGPADNQIFSANPGARTIAADYEAAGVRFLKADKSAGSRVSGAIKIRDRLIASKRWADEGVMEAPGLFFFTDCRHTFRTLAAVQIDEREPDAYATDGEDHLADALRYRVLAKGYAASFKELAL